MRGLYLFNSKSNGSSRGNQKKFVKDSLWYKEDYLGCEGLAECICSLISPLNHVKYQTAFIGNKRGCVSADFCKGQEFTTLQDLLSRIPIEYNPFLDELSLLKGIDMICEGFLKYFNSDIYVYLVNKLKFDCIVLNEDTHLENIGFYTTDGLVVPAPLFDYGLSLLSNASYKETDYVHINFKPFGFKYHENIKQLSLLGAPLVMSRLIKFNDSIYDENTVQRMLRILNKSMDVTEGVLWKS